MKKSSKIISSKICIYSADLIRWLCKHRMMQNMSKCRLHRLIGLYRVFFVSEIQKVTFGS